MIKVRIGFFSFLELPAKQCGPLVYYKENGKVASTRLRVTFVSSKLVILGPGRLAMTL